MRYPLLFALLLLSAVLQTACKKDAIVQTIHTDTIIAGNQPPNYTGVPTSQIQLYVNKLYIDLLGREPSAAELNLHTNALIAQELSDASRAAIATTLMNDTAYYIRLFEQTAADFINGVGAVQIQEQYDLYDYIAYLDSLNGTTNYFIYYEMERLDSLAWATVELMNGALSLNHYYVRFMDNFFYDEVNMGSENFVKGAFDDLLLRAPTASELLNGVMMVDNQPSTLLLMDGVNKADFMRIVTECDGFYEGYVRKMYLQFLLREPNSQEVSEAVALFKPTGDFKAMQRKLLTSEEYAGF